MYDPFYFQSSYLDQFKKKISQDITKGVLFSFHKKDQDKKSKESSPALSPASEMPASRFLPSKKSESVLLTKKLSLVSKGITRIDVFPDIFQNVDVLFLSGNHIKSLNGLDQFKKLSTLSLNDNRIEKLSELNSLAKCPFLRHLNLENNPISDFVYYRYHVLNKIPQLTHLDGKLITDEERANCENILQQESTNLDVIFQNESDIAKLKVGIDMYRKDENFKYFLIERMKDLKIDYPNKDLCMNKKQVETIWGLLPVYSAQDKERIYDVLRLEAKKMYNIRRIGGGNIKSSKSKTTISEFDDYQACFLEIMLSQQKQISEIVNHMITLTQEAMRINMELEKNSRLYSKSMNPQNSSKFSPILPSPSSNYQNNTSLMFNSAQNTPLMTPKNQISNNNSPVNSLVSCLPPKQFIEESDTEGNDGKAPKSINSKSGNQKTIHDSLEVLKDENKKLKMKNQKLSSLNEQMKSNLQTFQKTNEDNVEIGQNLSMKIKDLQSKLKKTKKSSSTVEKFEDFDLHSEKINSNKIKAIETTQLSSNSYICDAPTKESPSKTQKSTLSIGALDTFSSRNDYHSETSSFSKNNQYSVNAQKAPSKASSSLGTSSQITILSEITVEEIIPQYKAEFFYLKKTKRKHFQAIVNFARRKKDERRKKIALQTLKIVNLKLKSFSDWNFKLQKLKFTRRLAELQAKHLLKKVFNFWHKRTDLIEKEKEGLFMHKIYLRNHFFSLWKNNLSSKKEQFIPNSIAAHHFQLKTKDKFFQAWKASFFALQVQESEKEKIADQANRFFLLRTGFNGLQKYLHEYSANLQDVAQGFSQKRNQKTLSFFFSLWVVKYNEASLLTNKEAIVKTVSNRALVKKMFGKWKSKLEVSNNVSDMKLQAIQFRTQKLQKRVFKIWKLKKIEVLNAKMKECISFQTFFKNLGKKYISAWKSFSDLQKKKRINKENAKNFMISRVFSIWKAKYEKKTTKTMLREKYTLISNKIDQKIAKNVVSAWFTYAMFKKRRRMCEIQLEMQVKTNKKQIYFHAWLKKFAFVSNSTKNFVVTQLNQSQIEIDQKQQQISIQQNGINQLESKLRSTNEEFSIKYTDLMEKTEIRNKTITESSKKIDYLQENLQNLEQENTNLNKSQEILMQKLFSAVKLSTNMRKLITDKDKTIEDMKKNASTQDTTIESLKKKVFSLEQNILNLKSKFSAENDRRKLLQHEIDLLQDQDSSLLSENAISIKNFSEKSSILENLELQDELDEEINASELLQISFRNPDPNLKTEKERFEEHLKQNFSSKPKNRKNEVNLDLKKPVEQRKSSKNELEDEVEEIDETSASEIEDEEDEEIEDDDISTSIEKEMFSEHDSLLKELNFLNKKENKFNDDVLRFERLKIGILNSGNENDKVMNTASSTGAITMNSQGSELIYENLSSVPNSSR